MLRPGIVGMRSFRKWKAVPMSYYLTYRVHAFSRHLERKINGVQRCAGQDGWLLGLVGISPLDQETAAAESLRGCLIF